MQVAASFLGRANYLKEKDSDSGEEFHPYFVILVDKEITQIQGSEIRLKTCLTEVPCDEVSILKDGNFCQYDPPSYYGFPTSELHYLIYMLLIY